MRPSLEMLLIIIALATHTRGLPYGELSPQLQTQEKLVWYDGNRILQAPNVYSTYKDNAISEQVDQAQFNWAQSQQNTFEDSTSQKQLNSDYAYQIDQTLQPYSNVGFTVSCSGKNKVCVDKNLCFNGYVHPLKQGFIRSGQVQECKLNHEVCCTVQYDLNNSPYDNDQINAVLKGNQYPEPTLENDEKYVHYGEDNRADVTELTPPLKNDAELQSPSNDGYQIKPPNRSHEDIKLAEQAPIDYNQIPADTNQQEQYQTGDTNDSGTVTSPLRPASANSNPAVFQFTVHMGCAAALLCVEEQYCTLEGTISSEPVAFSSKELLQRVPLSDCRISKSGAAGKCCRDPNYVDPWPTGNLPANYSGGFDEQGFPTFLNIAKVQPPRKLVTQPPIETIPEPTKPPVYEQQQPLVPDNSNENPQRVLPISTPNPITPPISTPSPFIENSYEPTSSDQNPVPIVSELPLPNNPCGIRNYDQRPINLKKTDAAFAEIPWQAMVLWSEERKILCSGALISPDIVLTAASCVNRFPSNELSVKLGEWKLGYELLQEEPLPFQIINVKTIKHHPEYVEGLSSNDTAMLILDHPATFNLHINTLCLPDTYQLQETSQCIVTGWGKSILQAHYAGAIMHMVDVDLLSHNVCQNRILGAESLINIAHINHVICGKAHEENNMCQVDIGSPLACYDGNGAYYIAGIYSQDTGCLPTNQVATFAPVDIAWMKQIMYPSESQDNYDYQKSNLPAGNGYLPPV